MFIGLKNAGSLGLTCLLLMACTSQPDTTGANEDAAANASAGIAITQAANDTAAAAGEAASPTEAK